MNYKTAKSYQNLINLTFSHLLSAAVAMLLLIFTKPAALTVTDTGQWPVFPSKARSIFSEFHFCLVTLI